MSPEAIVENQAVLADLYKDPDFLEYLEENDVAEEEKHHS